MSSFGVEHIYGLISTLVLMVVRISVVLWVLPFLSEKLLSGVVRTAFAFSLSLLIFPVVYQDMPPGGVSLFLGAAIVIKEVFVGLILGFLIALPFWLITAVGFIVDTQRGAFIASLFSPFMEGQISPIGILLIQATAVLFLVSGGFLIMLKGVYQSFLLWPVTSFYPNINYEVTLFIINQFQWFLYSTALLAAPFIILMFLIDFSMGLLNRFVPQLNVFFLSLPIKGVSAIFLMVIYISSMFQFLEKHFMEFYQLVYKLDVLFR